MTEEKLTRTQQNALHLYFQLVAEALNDAGLDIQKTIEKSPIDIAWSRESVKELLWRPIQKTIYGKQSTTELEKSKEIDAVWENLNRFLAGLGIESVNFPSLSEIMNSQIDETD